LASVPSLATLTRTIVEFCAKTLTSTAGRSDHVVTCGRSIPATSIATVAAIGRRVTRSI
jgi:hypothetical protein